MRGKIVGYKPIHRVAEKTGQPYAGTEVAVLMDDVDFVGLSVGSMFVNEQCCPSENIVIGREYKIGMNRGKVYAFEPISDSEENTHEEQ